MLSLDEGEKCHHTRALDGTCESTLVEHTDLGSLARDDLRKGGEESTEDIHVLVIHVLNVVVAEVALLLFLYSRILFFHRG